MFCHTLTRSVLAVACLHLTTALAEPTLVSASPVNGASPAGPFVFTFSEPMNPAATTVDFIDFTTFLTLPTADAWSGGNTILTCTPSPAFPANRQIVWSASGENQLGDPLGGTLLGGLFTTGTGSGSGGSGTNAITTFSVGKVHHYNQTSAASPTLDPDTPYNFVATTMLASNRTATGVTVTLPTGSVSNLLQLPPPEAEIFLVGAKYTSLSSFDTTFPAGNYTFFVSAAASNQTVVVNLPTTNNLPQPGAPHLTNHPAAQAVNPGQPFVLGWDAFPNGAATNYIFVEIGTNNSYRSPPPGYPGALTGAARTFTIPAGTLQPNSNYFSRVGFYNFAGATNSSYATAAFRATFTEFWLTTTESDRLVLTNASWTGGLFHFDVLCTNGQTVSVEYTNAMAPGAWPKLLTTNSPGTKFHVVAPPAGTNKSFFFRARNGP